MQRKNREDGEELSSLLEAAERAARFERQRMGPDLDVVLAALSNARAGWKAAKVRFQLGNTVSREFGVAMRYTLRALGPLRMLEAAPSVENVLKPWKGRKGREFVAFLLVGRLEGVPRVPRARLLEALYPGTNEETGSRALYQTIHRLREVFGWEIVDHDDRGYALGAVPSDAEALLSAASMVGDDYADPMAAESALALYRGRLFEDLDVPWADEARARVSAGVLRLCAVVAPHHPSEATRALRVLLRDDPFDEVALAALLQACVLGGDESAASRTYALARTRFAREMNVQLPMNWREFQPNALNLRLGDSA
jgi:DNA-binding SARP family transcriptional activator